MLEKTYMPNQKLHRIEITHLKELFKQISAILADFAQDFDELIRYTQTPIETEEEVLERAKVMDELMDIATTEDDIVMLFAHAISDRIEAFENEQLDLPRMKPSQVLANLMQLHPTRQQDLFEIVPPNIISDLINEKRAMTIDQIKDFSKIFRVPVTMFIN
jgi:HTH-type transcriptional regulator/antitoxin HigA